MICISFSKTGSSEINQLMNRILDLDGPKLKYDFDQISKKKELPKMGQRKLLFIEIDFYVQILKTADPESILVVYAGAAPGYRGKEIVNMFPLLFYYYDCRDFYSELYKYKNIKIKQELFTDIEAKKYRDLANEQNLKLYLISDIRQSENMTDENKLQIVDEDMNLQKNWVDIMKPDLASLKLRFPWHSGKTEYYAGDIYVQPRIGRNSTETRLLTTGQKMVEYDHDSYNDRIMYFQCNNRAAYYDFYLTPAQQKINNCHCHDCWSEMKILEEYVTQVKKHQDVYRKLFKKWMGLSETEIDKKMSLITNVESIWIFINKKFPIKSGPIKYERN